MRRFVLLVCALAALLPSSIASASPYENAAKLDVEHLASSILAASVCDGVRFNGDTLVTSLAAAVVLLGRARTQDTFFSAMKANIDRMAGAGQEAWCAETIKAAKEQNWETLLEGDNANTK